MVATKLLISLCVAGLARAAPQLGAPVNQQVIVTDVVTALQPSIARAVAEALRGLGGSSSFSSSNSNRFSSGSSTSSGSFGSSSSSNRNSGSSFSSGDVASAEPTARPEYAYEFKVADEDEQTFISQSESRDGDDVVGTYSYVDPLGDLITVNYQAGLDGYTQTLDKQVGAVEIRAKPARVSGSTSTSSSQSSRGSSSSFGSSSRGSSSSFGSSSRGLDQSALIAQILSVLEPQISVAVNNVVGARG